MQSEYQRAGSHYVSQVVLLLRASLLLFLLKVVFENNGPKIPEEIAETIFQKFYTTKSKKRGSGLGLSIVKNVLKEHKADIIVESSETLTKFIITFDI